VSIDSSVFLFLTQRVRSVIQVTLTLFETLIGFFPWSSLR
jgi:hypothetical protein